MSSAAPAQVKTDWKLVIHGGAGTIQKARIPAEKEQEIRAALDRALAEGSRILSAGGSALDAVEASVRALVSCSARATRIAGHQVWMVFASRVVSAMVASRAAS